MARIPTPVAAAQAFADRIAKKDRLNLGADDQFAAAQAKAKRLSKKAAAAPVLYIGPKQRAAKAYSSGKMKKSLS